MKPVILSLLVLISASFAQAAADSVAVFHRPEKVVVLINEQYQGRLQGFMDHFDVQNDLDVEAIDGSVLVRCGRKVDAASCTLTFYPSKQVRVGNKTLDAAIPLIEMNLPEVENFEMSFESSREDKMTLKIQDGVLKVQASKRVL